MLHIIAFISAVAVIGTGIFVLAAGDWRPFTLKFAGVCLSTSAAIYMLTARIIFGNFNYCSGETLPIVCLTFELYYITRNVAFILFHIAIGRDAIHFKKRDRRGTIKCQKSSLKPSPR